MTSEVAPETRDFTDANGKVHSLTFERWYATVDRAVSRLAGVGIDDLADGPSWDNWDAGTLPMDYAREQLANEGFPF